MSEVEEGLSRGGMGLKGLVEGEAGVEHRGHRGQAPLASGGSPLPAFLAPPHGRPSRAAGFTEPPVVPGASAAAREIGRVALGRMEAGISSDAPLTLSRYDQGEEVVIRGMSGLPRPRPAREGKPPAARHALTRPACRLGRRGGRPPLGGSLTKYGKNKFFGRHGCLLPSSVWGLEG